MSFALPNFGGIINWVKRESGWAGPWYEEKVKHDALLPGVLMSVTANEPGAPINGDVHYIPPGATGTFFNANQGKLAVYLTEKPVNPAPAPGYTPASGWFAWAIPDDLTMYIRDENEFQYWNGMLWSTTDGATLAAANAYADGLVVGLWDDRGNYDASVNQYPTSGGSGTAGAIKKGDIWTVSVAGTLQTSRPVLPGDTVRALQDSPNPTTEAHWAIAENNIGYEPTNAAIVPNTAPAAGRVLVGNAGGTAYAPVAMSGDATLASTGALTLETVPIAKGGTGATTAAAAVDALGGAPALGTGGIVRATSNGGRFLSRTVKTSGTTFTTGASTTKLMVTAYGGGGGGGGVVGNVSSGSGGGGGAAGAKVSKVYTVTPSTGYTCAIGAAGAAGAAGNNAGGAGGDSTFTDGVTLITAKGGLGGAGDPANATAFGTWIAGGLGVIGINGDVNGAGMNGGLGLSLVQGASFVKGGEGGSSELGSGGAAVVPTGTGSFAANAGIGYASGGSGPATYVGADTAGAAGTQGVIIFDEYS